MGSRAWWPRPEEQAAIIVNVRALRQEGTVTVAEGTDEAGHAVLFARDGRMMRDVAERLAAGEGPVPVSIEPWQIMAG